MARCAHATRLMACCTPAAAPAPGAIDTVPLGGLVGENIFLVPERVRKLVGRVRKWVELR